MVASIIAAVSALAGAMVAGLMQHLTNTRTVRQARDHQHRAELADALLDVMNAVVRFRQEQWLKHAAVAEGKPDTGEARRLRYEARTALTRAWDRVHLLTADTALLAAVQKARNTAIAVSEVPTDDTPEAEAARRQVRQESRQAHTDLRVLAARHLRTIRP
ncbi:hypothetical protein [Streptomyces sp. PT12]|uniref:hypothetical protein n=1 Tax=Streptomyces sp. PT12 TaxID=1510197 RepID=UPI000DE409DC|nr:hypothetical protein [Streptomyces sp. PT12]RBM05658.1 hypothetical protein DEH69_28200 [Streptomyces sp. PT12]